MAIQTQLKLHKKGEKGERGVGFSLTADEHYHSNNKRLTNVSAPVDNITQPQKNSSLIY